MRKISNPDLLAQANLDESNKQESSKKRRITEQMLVLKAEADKAEEIRRQALAQETQKASVGAASYRDLSLQPAPIVVPKADGTKVEKPSVLKLDSIDSDSDDQALHQLFKEIDTVLADDQEAAAAWKKLITEIDFEASAEATHDLRSQGQQKVEKNPSPKPSVQPEQDKAKVQVDAPVLVQQDQPQPAQVPVQPDQLNGLAQVPAPVQQGPLQQQPAQAPAPVQQRQLQHPNQVAPSSQAPAPRLTLLGSGIMIVLNPNAQFTPQERQALDRTMDRMQHRLFRAQYIAQVIEHAERMEDPSKLNDFMEKQVQTLAYLLSGSGYTIFDEAQKQNVNSNRGISSGPSFGHGYSEEK